MAKERKKLSKRAVKAIVAAALIIIITVSLLITDIFVPVKFLASYFVLRNKSAEKGVMRVRFVDVGYGDCTVIELPDGKNMLIDGGDGSYKNQLRLFRFLNKCDIDSIDYLICSSVNPEHCGGLADVVKYKKVKNIYLPYCANTYITEDYRDFYVEASRSGADIVYSEYGVSQSGDDYFFEFLSPSVHENGEGEYGDLADDPTGNNVKNNASAVVWLEYSGTAFLFAGDITGEVESKILFNFSVGAYPRLEPAHCKVLKVANHGHKDSSSAEFVDFFSPETAVISVGDGAYGCPSVEALSNIVNKVGEEVYITENYGTVTLEITPKGYKIV